jgi:hypothetical protein
MRQASKTTDVAYTPETNREDDLCQDGELRNRFPSSAFSKRIKREFCRFPASEGNSEVFGDVPVRSDVFYRSLGASATGLSGSPSGSDTRCRR